MSLSLSVARRFMRSRSLARSTGLMAVTAATLVGLYVTLTAFTLSGAQVVQRDLGRFSALMELHDVGVPVGGSPTDRAVVRAARNAGADDATVILTSFEVHPNLAHPPLTVYTEANWPTQPFPDRYSLVTGHWPSRPGQAVVSEPLADLVNRTGLVDAQGMLPVFSGNEHLRVVGVIRDRFGKAPRILAADGTWDSFGSATRRRFPITANSTLYWNGGDADRIATAVTSAISATSLDLSPVEITAHLRSRTRTRAGELARERRSWIDRLPIVYRIPSLALPLLSILTIFGLNNRRFRSSTAILRSVGMTRRQATGGVALATVAWTLISTVLGCGVGIGLGAVARPICDAVLAGPISPFPALGPVLSRVGVVAVASCLLATAVLHLTGRRTATTAPLTYGLRSARRRTSMATVRHVLAAAAGIAAIAQLATLDTIPEAMFMAGLVGVAVLALTTEAVDIAIRLLPDRGPRSRLSRRQLANDRERAVAAVAVLAAVLGAPLALLTLLATLIDVAQQDLTSPVPPHQIVLSARGGKLHAPSPEVVRAVTGRISTDDPAIQVKYLRTDAKLVTVRGAGLGTVLAVDTVEQATRLNNGPLTAAQVRTLRRGGMLVWDRNGRGQRVLQVSDQQTGQVLSVTKPVQAVPAAFPAQWESSVSGMLLTATTQRLGLPITPGATVFTGVSESQATTAESAVRAAGLDPAQIDIYQPPEPVSVPPVFYTAVLALGLVVLATTMTVARTQVITLRGYLGRLISIGLSPRWARHVLLLQAGVVITTSTTLAIVFAIPAIIVAAVRLPHITVSVPWSWLGLTVGAFYLATALAIMVSSRRLRSADRLAG